MYKLKSKLRTNIFILNVIIFIGSGLLYQKTDLISLWQKNSSFIDLSKGPEIIQYDMTQPTKKDLQCINTSLTPSTMICLYDKKEDIFISRVIRKKGHCQGELVTLIMMLLEKNPECGFFDIGANIGMHTLTIAKMGRKVVAVEPNIKNVWRLHRAAELSGTICYITMVTNGLSDVREKSNLVFPVANHPGIAHVVQGQNCTLNCVQRIDTILMDDLLPLVPFKSAIMKIDIEGLEFKAFAHAEKLLDAIDIRYIMMEWFRMKIYHLNNKENEKMIMNMIYMLIRRGYQPYGKIKKNDRLDPGNVSRWPHDIVWIKGPKYI